ncbi:MAG: nicotinamide mononucleotide transporter [Bacteroidales bacterium]|nr:nicotinamide mononucleotide transporter [Bacteroidales bacterium]
MIGQVFNWIIEKLPELIATLSGLLYIIYSIDRKVIAWPYGILSSAIYVYVFLKAGIFADMAVYVYYVIIGFYGWYNWSKAEDNLNIPVNKTGLKLKWVLSAITVLLFIGIAFILKNFTTSTIPYWDAFTTALSITATWMLTRRLIEHWLLWIVVDSVSIGLYLYKGLYPSIILFAVYTIFGHCWL